MPLSSLKEASGDILAFSTLLGHDGKEKETENMDCVSDTSVKNAVIPSKSSLETTRMCTCWTMKSSQREVRFHLWQWHHGHCRNVAGIWLLGSGGWNELLFPWGCSGVQVEKHLAVKATSPPVCYCPWYKQFCEISLPSLKKNTTQGSTIWMSS